MGDITTVKVQKKTRDRLTKFGNKSETFDDIINRLMNFYEKNKQTRKGGLGRADTGLDRKGTKVR